MRRETKPRARTIEEARTLHPPERLAALAVLAEAMIEGNFFWDSETGEPCLSIPNLYRTAATLPELACLIAVRLGIEPEAVRAAFNWDLE